MPGGEVPGVSLEEWVVLCLICEKPPGRRHARRDPRRASRRTKAALNAFDIT